MSALTCRYCAFYCPSFLTPIIGDCAAFSPPKRIDALYADCPFGGDSAEISKSLRARGFEGHDLRKLLYYGENSEGRRTRIFYELADLRRYISYSGVPYEIIVCYIDSDNHVFARTMISEGEGV